MKKIVAILAAICLLFAGGLMYYNNKGVKEAEVTSTSDSYYTSYSDVASMSSTTVDYEKIYALHDPDEVVMTVGDRDITWSEYFYNLYSYSTQVEQFLAYAPLYYGMSVTWDDIADESTGVTYAELPTVYAEEQSKTQAGVFSYAEENGIDFDESCEQTYQQALQSNIESAGAANEEEFYEQLKSIYVTPTIVENQFKSNILLSKGFAEAYGENGDKIDDEKVINYLEDNNYMHAMHILFKNFDLSGEAISEEALADKKAQAEQVLTELKAIEDDEERKEKFIELAAAYNEDSMSEYSFTEGEMVPTFEQGIKDLADYEVAIVETQYGIHVIMRLPLDPNAIDTSGDSFKAIVAENDYNEILSAFIEGLTVKFADGFVAPQVKDYMN